MDQHVTHGEGPAHDPTEAAEPRVGEHAGHGTHQGPVSWAMAAQATLHCLTGRAIGEVLGMVIGTSVELHDAATVALSVTLAFFFGYALTMRGVLKAGCRSARP